MEEKKENILVVEDEEIARKNLEHVLSKEGYRVLAVDNGAKAIRLLKETEFDLVITDLKMEKIDGLEVLKKSREYQPYTEVVMITGYATVDSAVTSIKEGAYHYIAKPYKIDEVRRVTREALIKRRLLLENLQLKDYLRRAHPVPYIVGQSEAMRAVLETIQQISRSDANVLILGESGTGKELAAKAIHHLSPRSENRFVAFNCGSFTEELMAGELFGYEKGAFTGAVRDKVGLLEVADGGTVFLDEIGDMPHSMQVKLLRVIQEGEFLKVGGVHPVSVDLRFIAATHRDLKKDVENGRFREDLCYRLDVINLRLPPLVDRKGDIQLLVHHFLDRKGKAANKEGLEIEQEAMDLLNSYDWPGNVRELENVIERAVALAKGPLIRVADLPEYIRRLDIETYRRPSSAIPTLEEQEKNYIRWVLQKCNGNKTTAARMMGIDRVSLWRKIKRYRLE